jgi:Kef-type K+ transport system membrane component KefB
MQSALPAFFLVLLTGLLSSTLLKKLHLPWVAALLLGGVLIGPYGLDIFEPDSTVKFISDMGLVFLMFMAGLEVKLSGFKKCVLSFFALSVVNGLLPFVVGMGIAYYYGYSRITMFLLGTVFVSSSIAVVIPTLEANNLFDLKIGKAVMATSIIQDVASLFLLSACRPSSFTPFC